MIISVNRLSLSTFRLLTLGTSLLLLFFVVFSCVDRVSGTDYTLTTRVTPTEAVFDGKTYTQLTSNDKLIVTAGAAQIWLAGSSATLDCNVDVSGKSYGSEKTGKIRMQMSSAQVANFNGTVNLVGDTYIGSHGWQSNQGTLYFNSQITGAGALIVAPGRYSVVHLNNTTSANNYQGNTQIGSTDMYNNSGNTNYGGTIILDADEQIPDALTVGASCAGNLVMMSWADGSDRLTSTLNLNGHTETVNGLVSADHLSVITGDGNSKLIVGANNATSEFGGIIQGAMQLQKIGSGTLTLSGASTYTGATTISEGTVKVTAPGTLGTGTATMAAGTTVEIATSETPWTWGGGVINGDGTLKVTGSGEFSMPSSQMQVSTNGSIIVDGAKMTLTNPTINFPGKNVYINNGGTFGFDRTNTSYAGIYFQTSPNFIFDENGGGTFSTGDLTPGGSYLNIISASTMTFITNGGATNYITGTNGINTHQYNVIFDVAKGTSADGKDLVVSARLWNGKGIEKNGAGTMVLTCNNDYSGGTTINAGAIRLAEDGVPGTGAVSIGENGALEFAYDTDHTLSNAISGSGTLVQKGPGTAKLNGTNTFAGNAKIEAGTLSFLMNGTNKNLNVKKVSGSGDLVLRLASGNGDTRVPSIVNDGFTGAISLVQEGGANGNKINSNGQTFEGFKIKVNPGTSIYIQGNEFKADVSISGNGNSENRGALRVANTLSGNLTVAADANIGVDGTRTISSPIVSGAASGETTLFINGKTDGTTVTANAGAGTFSGNISDGTAGSKLGLRIVSNTQTFTGALSYTGATTINSGATMSLTGANTSLADSRAVNVNGTLNFTGYTGAEDMQFNNLTGTNGTIIGTGKNLALTSDTESTFTGTIDAANLNITSGTFNLNGSTTGDVTVNPGAVFSGTAEIGGVLTVAADDAKLVMKLGGTDATQNDLLIVSGNLALSEGKVFLQLAEGSALKGGDSFTAVLSGLNSADLADDFIANYVSSPIFTDLAYSQLTTGEFAGLYAITGSLDANAIPEPATWALLLFGVFGLLWGRCFQRRLGKNITDA